MAFPRTRSLRTALSGLAVVTASMVAVTLLPAVGQADPGLTVAQAEARVSALQHEAEQAQEQVNQTQVALVQVQKRLAQVRDRQRRSQAQLDALKASVGALAAAAYRSGGVDQTLQLLLADDPSQFLQQASTLDGVSRRESDVLRRVATARQRLAQDKAAVAEQLTAQQKLRNAAASEKAQVDAKVRAAVAVVSSLKATERAKFEARRAAEARAAAAAAAAARRDAAKHRADAARASRGSSHRPSTGGGSGGGGSVGGGSGIGARAASYAMAQLGDRYVWGATGPSAFDCSGLTMRAYASVGISLPHSSRAQYGSGRHVSASQLRPGDLVFYYSPISHVGIYIGGGSIVDAANPRSGVRVTSLYSMPYSGAVRPY